MTWSYAFTNGAAKPRATRTRAKTMDMTCREAATQGVPAESRDLLEFTTARARSHLMGT